MSAFHPEQTFAPPDFPALQAAECEIVTTIFLIVDTKLNLTPLSQ
jgi:hypothetical protein